MSDALRRRALVLACALPLLAACSTKPATQNTGAEPVTGAVQHVQSEILPGSAKDFEVNVGDTIHFDYDRPDIRSADGAILSRQASWLNKYPTVHVTIEGHCDERGTRAYNLALGAKRAEATKDYLMSLGVSGTRIETISYGKERPVCAESTESCWAMNRRAVTVVSPGSPRSA